MAQGKRIRLGTMMLQVRSLAWLSGLRIWLCCELWCRLQMWLGSGIAVVQAGSYSSEQTPSLGTSMCHGCIPKKTKDKKKKKKKKEKVFKTTRKKKYPCLSSKSHIPVRNGSSSVRVLSTPSARAIVDNFLILLRRSFKKERRSRCDIEQKTIIANR